MAWWSNIAGTALGYFRLGLSGVRLKNDAGALSVRNAGDSAVADAKFGAWLNTDGTENYKCRAWVNFNGTGTVAIRAAGNVSSITDAGVGIFAVNFTTPMQDDKYGFGGCCRGTGANPYVVGVSTTAPTASALTVGTIHNPTTGLVAVDVEYVSVAIFR